jgi:hypothetical protein
MGLPKSQERFYFLGGFTMKCYSTSQKVLMLLSLVAAIFLFGVTFSYTAYAGEIHIQWDPNPEPDIQCYRVYMGTQIDMVTWTWEQVGEVAVPATELVYDVPVNALRLYRVSAVDLAGQESIRYNAGVFSCPDWVPPGEPSCAGIE